MAFDALELARIEALDERRVARLLAERRGPRRGDGATPVP